MSQAKIKVIKSPTSPVRIPDYDSVMYANKVVYFIRLSNGLIATRPDDFPKDSENKTEA